MIYRFENYVLDPGRRELRRGAVIRPVEPQVFDLLEYLIQNRGRVVSRDDLLKAIWNRRFVSESVLSTRINAARNVIGDNGQEQRLIRTLRQKGFRFIGVVHEDKMEIRAGTKIVPHGHTLALVLQERPAIAVLPFKNIDGDAEYEGLSAGITEDLITALSKADWFYVISRHSSFTSKGKATEIKQVAHKLGVRYILEGSVRLIVNRVCISVQLLDGVSGRYLWAERYDQFISDRFALKDEITEKIVTAVHLSLFAAEDMRAKSKSSESFNAWECIVRALSLMNSREKAHIATARSLLQKAIALDPKSAEAHSLLSFVTTLCVHMGWKPPQSTLPLALNIARKALNLDPDESWAHVALGYAMVWGKQSDNAFIGFEKALALNPNSAIANYMISLASSFFLGRNDNAFAHADRAVRLSPYDLLARGNTGIYNNVRGTACFVAERYREGIEFTRKAIVESPNLTPAYRAYIANCALAGELKEARAALQTLQRLLPDISLRWIKDTMPYVRTEEQQRYSEAFRLAGLK